MLMLHLQSFFVIYAFICKVYNFLYQSQRNFLNQMLKNLIKVSVFNSSRYDAAIKAMKASPYYPTAEKLSQYRARELDAKKKRSIDGIDKHNWQPQNPRRQGEQDLDPDEYRKLIQKSISSERFERYMNMFHEPNYQ